MKYFCIALLLAVVAGSATNRAVAQQQAKRDALEFFSFGDDYFLEVTTMPGNTEGKERAVVLFRLTYDLLTFKKTTALDATHSTYTATPVVYVEAVGSDGVIVDQGRWTDTVIITDYTQTNSKQIFITGSMELALRPGLYTVKYDIGNGAPGSGFTRTTPAFKMDAFNSPSPAIGTPVFLKAMQGETLTAAAVDGNAYFGRPLLAYIPLASSNGEGSLQYDLLHSPEQTSGAPVSVGNGFGKMLGNVELGNAIQAGNEIQMTLRRPAEQIHSYGALLDIPTATLDIGDYILLLRYTAGGNSVTDSVRFKLRWVDMPVSLSNPLYAMKALYPIATEDEIDDLRSAGKDEREAELRKFWDAKDPTPGTKYNEKMAEYYRRVDYAYLNLGTLEEKDGVFTDRGKIYILFGPPTETHRELAPNAEPKEIWTYTNAVAREFVFLDKGSAGKYRLVEYYDL